MGRLEDELRGLETQIVLGETIAKTSLAKAEAAKRQEAIDIENDKLTQMTAAKLFTDIAYREVIGAKFLALQQQLDGLGKGKWKIETHGGDAVVGIDGEDGEGYSTYHENSILFYGYFLMGPWSREGSRQVRKGIFAGYTGRTSKASREKDPDGHYYCFQFCVGEVRATLKGLFSSEKLIFDSSFDGGQARFGRVGNLGHPQIDADIRNPGSGTYHALDEFTSGRILELYPTLRK
jgi:hypothetical protein